MSACLCQEVLVDRCSPHLHVTTVHGVPWVCRTIGRAYDHLWTAAERRGGVFAIGFALLGPVLDAAAAVALSY